MNSQLALTSVVTAAVLDEFKFMKFSFELFHGTGYQWFVRCDRASQEALSAIPNVSCRTFTDSVAERPDMESAEFLTIVGEKMNSIADGWNGGNWTGVIFLDADLIITSPVINNISGIEGEVLLTPNYYPAENRHFAPIHGYYNSGFVFTRSRDFHGWWRDAFTSQPWRWTDQACLNDAHGQFVVGDLSDRANIGFWRSAHIPQYEAIPADCEFLHVHLFQPLQTYRQWMDKTFALHCLKFLQQSHIPEHKRLFREVFVRYPSRYYETYVRLCRERAATYLKPAERLTG